MILYSKEEIDLIQSNLLAGKTKFLVGECKAYFSKQGKSLIQRIDNFMLGLAYDIELNQFIPNYPHLNNIRDNQLAELEKTKTVGYWCPLIAQEKRNGTNLGIVKPLTAIGAVNELYYRCRGSIEPETFLNDINKRLATGQKNYVGINDDIFKSFCEKYEPIFKEGIRTGLLDNFGNFNVAKIAPELKTRCIYYFNDHPEAIGIFGELISKYNPIAVDSQLSHGLYLDSPLDYEWVVFDVMKRDKEGNIYLDSNNLTDLSRYGIQTVKTIPFHKLSLTDFTAEEGVVVKGFENQYLKLKHADIMEWARMMGTLATVINNSISHIFSQGLGFSKIDIFERLILFEKTTIDGIVQQVWEEINENGITRKDLEEYYAAKKKPLTTIDFDLADELNMNLMLLIAPMLKANGVGKETLYQEIPKLLYFSRPALFFDDKKKKYRANGWYGKMLGTTIGRCYLTSFSGNETNAPRQNTKNGNGDGSPATAKNPPSKEERP